MRRRWLGRLGPVVLLCALGALAYDNLNWFLWLERADATGVARELQPARLLIRKGESPRLTVRVVNRGDREVVLVEPGDGSQEGWRTPLVDWSTGDRGSRGRCANVNALKPGEVFVLRPGESRVLGQWVGGPALPGPGRYRVVLRYTNDPTREWHGVPLSPHDPATMEEVRRSTAVSAVSNTVELTVVE